jgi:hypothetical protein
MCSLFAQASYLFPFSLSCMMMMDSDELAAMQQATERLTIDPAITVADLELCLQSYFDVVGYRNMQEIVDIIVDGKCTWRTAPKAEGLEI